MRIPQQIVAKIFPAVHTSFTLFPFSIALPSGVRGTLLYLLTAGLCNARFVALLLDIIGPDDRDPSTWFSVLLSAGQIPIASMIWLEGQTFTKFGTHGLLWTDAAANLVIFTVVAAVFATLGLGLRNLSAAKANASTL